MAFTVKVESVLSDQNFHIKVEPQWQYIDDVDEGPWEPAEGEVPHPEVDIDSYNHLIGSEVLLPNGDSMETGTVVKRAKDAEGNPIGRTHANPVLDTSQYTVEFSSGDSKEYAANSIVESMISQCDSEGRQYLLFDGIVGHEKSRDAVEVSDGEFTTN